MTPQELRVRAVQECDELGPIPLDRHRRETWCEGRRRAAARLARLADSDPALLRRATLEPAGDCSDQSVVALLLDAALAHFDMGVPVPTPGPVREPRLRRGARLTTTG